MAHSVPKELKGEERFFSIPVANIHFSKKGVFYNGLVTAIAAGIGKMTNGWVFLALFIIFNIIAYPLAHMKIPKSRFEGGNVGLDIFAIRWFRYRKFNKNLYIRRRGQ